MKYIKTYLTHYLLLTLRENDDGIMVSSSESSSESPSSSASCHSTLGPRWKRRRVPEYQHNNATWRISRCVLVLIRECWKNLCNTVVWTQEVRISLQMFVILAYPGKGRILSQKHKQKISVSTSLLFLSKTVLIACLLVISTVWERSG